MSQGYNPQDGQGFNPQGFNPQGGQGFNPQGFNPQGFDPQGGQGFNPQGFNPQGGQGFNPQGFDPQGDDPQPYPNIQSPMVWSILSMVLSVLSSFCCCLLSGIFSLPTAIVSIVYATKVNSLLSVGNFQAAKETADKAKMWAWISLGICVVGIVLGIIINIVFVLPHLKESGFEMN